MIEDHNFRDHQTPQDSSLGSGKSLKQMAFHTD